jgi:hypothetical protein
MEFEWEVRLGRLRVSWGSGLGCPRQGYTVVNMLIVTLGRVRATGTTPGESDLASGPINVWVVYLQPIVSKEDLGSMKFRDCEQDPPAVSLNLQTGIQDGVDLSIDVGSSVSI